MFPFKTPCRKNKDFPVFSENVFYMIAILAFNELMKQ